MSDRLEVRLEWHEYSMAAHVGQMRTTESIRQGLKGSAQAHNSVNETEGAAAEMAVAKALGIYWDGSVNNFTEPDLPGLHVRYTHRTDGRLIIRPHDIDKFGGEATYVLVTGMRGLYVVRGAIRAVDAQRDEFWQAPGGRPGAWFVPQSSLSMECLMTPPSVITST